MLSLVHCVHQQGSMAPTYDAGAQQSPAGAFDVASVLGGSSAPPYGSPTAAVARMHGAFNGASSVADPMAAVFANVNRNLTGGQSVLNPWGEPIKEGGQEPTTPSTPSDFGMVVCISLKSYFH